jgi:hypothetical protein
MDEQTQSLLLKCFQLSALTVVIILDALIILIAKNKRYWSAESVIIAVFALTEAIYCFSWAIHCWPLIISFNYPLLTRVGWKFHYFTTEMSYILRYFTLSTIFVIIAKFKQMRLRTVCVVIFVEFAASATYALHMVYYNEVYGFKDVFALRWIHEETGEKTMKNILLLRLAGEALCFILAGTVLMTNRKQFKFGKSLGFLVTGLTSWLSHTALSSVLLEDVTINNGIRITLIIVNLIGLIAKSFFCLMMIEKGNEIPPKSDFFEDDVELVENRNH